MLGWLLNLGFAGSGGFEAPCNLDLAVIMRATAADAEGAMADTAVDGLGTMAGELDLAVIMDAVAVDTEGAMSDAAVDAEGAICD